MYIDLKSILLLVFVTVSEDDEIHYSIKPELYDSDPNVKDELWMAKKRDGRTLMMCLAVQLVSPLREGPFQTAEESIHRKSNEPIKKSYFATENLFWTVESTVLSDKVTDLKRALWRRLFRSQIV
ncbi:Uncharacterized protein Rs2_30235 [Raphanus sativus]|nr:Uncharacterized protein Rs2_30235 [Raphanus sativus]